MNIATKKWSKNDRTHHIMTPPPIATIKYKGKIFRVTKQPFETHEQHLDRAWYMALHYTPTLSYSQLEDQALQWMYEKYLGCK